MSKGKIGCLALWASCCIGFFGGFLLMADDAARHDGYVTELWGAVLYGGSMLVGILSAPTAAKWWDHG